MTVRVRFAPSPTGYIHIGNTRIALMNYLFALKQGGEFILRFDDTDIERSKQEYIDAIYKDLAWLGIKHDHVFKQSERFAKYDEATNLLKEKGLLYPCYDTPKELERRRKRQMARGLPPVYDRKALSLTKEEIQAFEEKGIKPHWRFKLDHKIVSWNDLVRGEQKIDAASLSDPVLIRADGTYLYTLPSCVDDIEMNITHVVRGEDHVANTGAQIQIFEALGGGLPQFAHTNLLISASGEGFSKRLGSLSIGTLANEGIEALSVAILAVLIGTSEAITPLGSMKELAEIFDFSKISRAPARFDVQDLTALNQKIIQEYSYEHISKRLHDLKFDKANEAFWLAIRGNISKIEEVSIWYNIVFGNIEPVIENEDREFISTARSLLPEGEIIKGFWGEWTKLVKQETGRKGRELFMPLRKALTGVDHGPELDALLPLIGRKEVESRLS